jgi:hypothetical protein
MSNLNKHEFLQKDKNSFVGYFSKRYIGHGFDKWDELELSLSIDFPSINKKVSINRSFPLIEIQNRIKDGKELFTFTV